MAELAGHRAEIADLPEQPLQGFLPAASGLRHEPPGALGQMDQDGAGFENRHRPVAKPVWGVVVDDRRHPVIGADPQELWLELVAAPDIDRDRAIFEAAFFEHDRDLPAVWCRPVIKIDHRLFSDRNAAISAAEYPSSVKTSCVCSPSAGAPRRMLAGVREKRAAGRD